MLRKILHEMALMLLISWACISASVAKSPDENAPIVAANSPEISGNLTHFLSTQGFVNTQYTRLDSGHALVEAQINGVYGHFIIDSGAGGTVVHRSQAAKFSLLPKRHAGTATGVGGDMDVLGTNVDTMQIGGSTVTLKGIYIMDLSHVVDALSPFTDHAIDGVIGQDFLQNHHAIIDIAEDTLYFRLN